MSGREIGTRRAEDGLAGVLHTAEARSCAALRAVWEDPRRREIARKSERMTRRSHDGIDAATKPGNPMRHPAPPATMGAADHGGRVRNRRARGCRTALGEATIGQYPRCPPTA
jgi:hypothetical protein